MIQKQKELHIGSSFLYYVGLRLESAFVVKLVLALCVWLSKPFQLLPHA